MTCAAFFVANMPVLCTIFKLDEDYVQNIKLMQVPPSHSGTCMAGRCQD